MTAPSVRQAIAAAETGKHRIDPARSSITFTTRHLFGLGTVRGSFQLRGGVVRIGDPVETSWARATIDVASVVTGHSQRDRTIRSPRLLDVRAYPDMSFVSERLTETAGQWFLHGSLSVRGTARQVEVTIDQLEWTSPALSIRASARIDRYAFGITDYRGMAARHLDVRLDLLAHRG